MADVDGDGRMDLVIDARYAIQVFRGNGDGTFQEAVVTRIANNAGFGVMAVGDLNQDGIPDVVLQEFYLDTVNLYFGKGDGTFGAAQVLNFPGDGPAQAIAIADLNGDGIPDLVDDLVEVALGRDTVRSLRLFTTPSMAIAFLLAAGRSGSATSRARDVWI